MNTLIKKVLRKIKQGNLLESILKILGIIKAQKKIQQEIEKALNLESSKSISVINKELHKSFYRSFYLYKGLPSDFIQELAKFIFYRRSGYLLSENDYLNLIKYAKKIDPACLSCEEWKKLSYISTFNGLFELSLAVQNKAIESAFQSISSRKISDHIWLELYKAAVDQSDFRNAHKAINILIAETDIHDYIKKNAFLNINIMRGNHHKALCLARSIYSDDDKRFAEYIEGKAVAVVGPAPTNEYLAEEINSFDIVVRINYRGHDHIPNKEEFGSKLDIAYYNGECAAVINKMEDKSFLRDLKYAVFKDLKQDYQKDIVREGKGRTIFQNRFVFNGSLNMLQNALYDLLHFKPSIIKVFKVNFYLAQKTHYRGYSPHERRTGYEWIWTAFANHNFISQVNFVKQLWRTNMIEVDKSCEAVLVLPEDKYVAMMEEIHVKKPLELLAGRESSNWNAINYRVVQ